VKTGEHSKPLVGMPSWA